MKMFAIGSSFTASAVVGGFCLWMLAEDRRSFDERLQQVQQRMNVLEDQNVQLQLDSWDIYLWVQFEEKQGVQPAAAEAIYREVEAKVRSFCWKEQIGVGRILHWHPHSKSSGCWSRLHIELLPDEGGQKITPELSRQWTKELTQMSTKDVRVSAVAIASRPVKQHH